MKLDDLVLKYITLRDRKSAMKREFDQSVEKIDAALTKMEAILLKTFQDTGQDAAKTKAGTAYTAERTSATVADRDAFMGWVMDDPEERMMFLENRVSKVAVEQYKSATSDIPPGVNFRSELVVNVRRK